MFKEAEKRYGTKANDYNIGELRQVVVPYTLSLLNTITENKLDLYRIWKNQQVSPQLSDFIYDLMKQVNKFILDNSPVTHYIEWAKKEECWEQVRNHSWSFNINEIKTDLIEDNNPSKRNIVADTEDSEETQQHEENILRSIPHALWKKIEAWGKDSGFLSTAQQAFAGFDMANKIKFNRAISDSDRSKAMTIFDIVCQHNMDLLLEAEKLTEETQEEAVKIKTDDHGITVELIQKMVDWDKRRRILKDWQWNVMNDILLGKKTLNSSLAWGCRKNLELLKKHGFSEEQN